jgi:hypothetical protein
MTTGMLTWHIVGEDREYRIRVALLLGLPAVLVGYILATNLMNLTQLGMLVGGFLFVWILLWIANELFYYPSRAYALTQYSVIITRGDTTKEYRWDEFRCFYEVGVRHLEDRVRKMVRNFDYQTVYLRRKKPFLGLVKTFTVLYVPPSLLPHVHAMLRSQLPQKPIGILTDAGFAHFEFR